MAYFSNGTEGDILNQQCCDCPLPDDSPCPILLMQLTFNYKQIINGKPSLASEVMNTLVNKKGECQMKPLLDKDWGKDTKTEDMFA